MEIWLPARVVKKHRRRATCVWVFILGLILAYSAWLVVNAVQNRKHPSVSLRVEPDVYPFPTVSFCFMNSSVAYGCNAKNFSCSNTTKLMVAKKSGELDDPSGTFTPNKARPLECKDFRVSDWDVTINTVVHPPQIFFALMWFLLPEDVDEEDIVGRFSESVLVFFTDPEILTPLGDHNMSMFVGNIPYTRQKANTRAENVSYTTITMEMTESINLDGGKAKTYFAGSVMSSTLVRKEGFLKNDNISQDMGFMFVDLFQPQLSRTVRKEIDSFEWTELVGNVGGTWELLLIFWGVLFIASKGEPDLRSRNLKKSAQRGVEGITKGAISVATVVGPRNYVDERNFCDQEEVPSWDNGADVATRRLQGSGGQDSTSNFATVEEEHPRLGGPAIESQKRHTQMEKPSMALSVIRPEKKTILHRIQEDRDGGISTFDSV